MGQVIYFEAQKQKIYSQTKSDTPPTKPFVFNLYCDLTTTAAGDATSKRSAKGCDTLAHEGCLMGSGQTVAVLALGIFK